MDLAAWLIPLRALWRGLLGLTPCCGQHGLLRHGLRAGRCPHCGTDFAPAQIEGAVPLLGGLAAAVAALGTASLIAVHLGPEHPALMPAALTAALGTVAVALPRVAGALIGWQWALGFGGFDGMAVVSLRPPAPSAHRQWCRRSMNEIQS